MSRRILEEETSSIIANDDYLYMDGQTNGARKINPNVMVEKTFAFNQMANDIFNVEEKANALEDDIEGIQTDITDLKNDIGDLEDLETEDKSSLVGAINEARGTGGGGLTEDVKVALLDCFEHVAWIDAHGQDYYDALEDALYPPAELVSISAVYTQSGTVYDTDTLDSLKTDLVVTAHMSDSTTQTVTTYTLSGTLTEGTSTITVTYSGKTATFTVTVTDSTAPPTQYTWLYDSENGELLSTESYVTYTLSGSGTEAIDDGYYVLTSPALPAGSSETNYHGFRFSDASTTDGKISCRAKLTEAIYTRTESIGFRLQLSNGTSGAQAYLVVVNNQLTVIYYEGATRKTVSTEYSISDFHIFELELSNGTQSLNIDGNQVFETSTLSSNYCTSNAIFQMSGAKNVTPNGIVTTIDWIAYYEVA